MLAIQRALACAKIEPELVDLVHLHGTGTQYNDAMEARAMAQVFEEQPAAASTKGQIGHTLGAAGVLESLVTLASLDARRAPPNPGLAELDPGATLNMQTESQRLPRADVALKLAAGFGGINAAVVFQGERC